MFRLTTLKLLISVSLKLFRFYLWFRLSIFYNIFLFLHTRLPKFSTSVEVLILCRTNNWWLFSVHSVIFFFFSCLLSALFSCFALKLYHNWDAINVLLTSRFQLYIYFFSKSRWSFEFITFGIESKIWLVSKCGHTITIKYAIPLPVIYFDSGFTDSNCL